MKPPVQHPECPPQKEGESDEQFLDRQRAAYRGWRGWPNQVEPLGIWRIDLLGVDPTNNQLYWDGQPVVTKHALGRREFFLAALAAWSTAIATLVAAFAFAFSVYKG